MPCRGTEIVIEPHAGWFQVDWRGVLQYRDLLLMLVRRDFLVKYKQTILGPAWFLLQPLLATLVFSLIFGRVAALPTDGIPPFLFYLSGLVAWIYFSECLRLVSSSLLDHARLLEKVFFPRLVLPLSIVLSNLLAFAVQLAAFLLVYLLYKYAGGARIAPNFFVLLLPAVVLQAALAALGAGLWVAALTARYRDFHHLVGFAVQLWLFLTPVIYPSSALPERWRWLMALNPVAGVIDCLRYAFFGAGELGGRALLSALVAVALFASGLLAFGKVERTFVDVI